MRQIIESAAVKIASTLLGGFIGESKKFAEKGENVAVAMKLVICRSITRINYAARKSLNSLSELIARNCVLLHRVDGEIVATSFFMCH